VAPNQNNWHLSVADGHTGGLTGGEGRGKCSASYVSCLENVCMCTTSGLWSTDMLVKKLINEATLHPSGQPQHHMAKPTKILSFCVIW